MKFEFHPDVFSDVDEIMTFYESQAGSALADDFYKEFRQSVLLAASDPGRFRIRIGDIRRTNLRRFPFHFLFRVVDGRLRVLVVRHHRRNPQYGILRE